MPTVMDWRLELVQVPVSDVDRAKSFYTEKAGFHEDHDHRVSDEIRFVQLTPPGSACSIALGTGLSGMPPGSVQGLQLVVPDINAARAEFVERGGPMLVDVRCDREATTPIAPWADAVRHPDIFAE